MITIEIYEADFFKSATYPNEANGNWLVSDYYDEVDFPVLEQLFAQMMSWA